MKTKALVVHATKLKERGEHVDNMLRSMGIDYEFICEGDVDGLTEELLDRFFVDGREAMHQPTSRTSCAVKHFLAYEYIVKNNLSEALILEDDIVLHKNFVPLFERSLNEYRSEYFDKNVMISYEDSTLKLVPRSMRQKGKMLYIGTRDRTTGAYLINQHAAKAILNDLKKEKCDVPVDWYHNQLIQHGKVVYLWCHPAIATQGSFSGAFYSSLSSKSNRLLSIRWWFKKNYKRLLYWFR